MISMSTLRYTPDRKGMRDLALSAEVQSAAVDAGMLVASAAAGFDPNGQYSVRGTGVHAGRSDELRAGAVVTDELATGGGKIESLKNALVQESE